MKIVREPIFGLRVTEDFARIMQAFEKEFETQISKRPGPEPEPDSPGPNVPPMKLIDNS